MNRKPSGSWNPESVATFWINHASRLLMRRFEEALRPLGFGSASLPVVWVLSVEGALQQKELVERMRVEQPTMAALLARMERDGMVKRKADPTDGRASRISLTARGEARLPEARRVLADSAEAALDGLSERDRATLMKLLQHVVTNLERDERTLE